MSSSLGSRWVLLPYGVSSFNIGNFFTVLAVNVDWQIQSPVSFGKVAHLNCKISDPNFNCSRQLRQWLGGEHYGSLCYENKCNASEKKYNIVQTENMCVYTLMIERFSEHDVNCEYTCSYGIWRKRKHLTLDEMKFICKYIHCLYNFISVYWPEIMYG